ncbi:hypothetical protein [Usitatibacter palustris]|uniref:Protein TonB, links inner and outer membranes n=1 Tax=Usitatibacter palustris TaxID=2732487 RepID=A0A6M4H3P1_9PROT|nr:hypothetical protein [Usitatibacter palustris]QJR13955.1 hypothetical protein DSM104440_00747 [Usitatibacter palustris]
MMIRLRNHRRIQIAVGLSLLAHAALLAIPMREQIKMSESLSSEVYGPITVRIAPAAPKKPPTAEQQPAPEPPKPEPTPQPPRPPVVASRKPSPDAPKIPEPPPTPTREPPREPQPPMDMQALVEARRARRMATRPLGPGPDTNPPPPDNAQLALNRNIQSLQRGEGGPGGVFQILRMGPRTAEFAFNGWRPNASKGWREVIEVDAGTGGNVELAVIRRMIQLIRTHYQGDFNWESHRMGRVIVLSARPEDTEGLEDFMMREFFGTPVLKTTR